MNFFRDAIFPPLEWLGAHPMVTVVVGVLALAVVAMLSRRR